MPLMLYLRPRVLLPESFCTRQEWDRVDRNVLKLIEQQVECRDDVVEIVEAIGGLKHLVAGGQFVLRSEKQCKGVCGLVKPITDFPRGGGTFRGECHPCYAERIRLTRRERVAS